MTLRIAAIGEAMIELAPVDGGVYRRAFAGDTFNTVWHMAQMLGNKGRCRFVTRVGTDSLSQDFLDELAGDGLNIDGISRDPDRTMGLYLIQLDGVERRFHYWRDASAARRLADDPAVLDRAIAEAELVYLSGITLAILPPAGRDTLFHTLDRVRESGAKVAFDPNYRPRLWASPEMAREVTGRMLTRTDIVLPSFDDENSLWGDRSPAETAGRYLNAGVSEVAVKNGGAGVFCRTEKGLEMVETPPPEAIRDTSGAGDGFNAGYLCARLAGSPPPEAAMAGHLVACEVLRHPGARAPKADFLRAAEGWDFRLPGKGV